MTRLVLDYETFSEVDLRTKGLDLYTAHPSARVLMCAYAFDDGPITLWEAHKGPLPADLREALLDPAVERWAFNAQFERVVTRRMLGLKTPYEGWRCTMSLAYLQCFKGTLDEVGKQMGLADAVTKDKEGDRLIRLFSMPQRVTKKQPHRIRDWRTDPADWNRFGEYCRQDVVAETAVWKRLIRFPIPAIEWELYELDQRINDRGKPVDMVFVQNAIEMVAKRKSEIVNQMKELTGLANPNSVSQFLPWLKDRGYPFDDLGADTVEKVLRDNTDAERPFITRECETALKLRQGSARTSVKKYDKLRDTTGRGDRARFLFQFAGASRTARWAGRRVQTQNLPRTPSAIEPEESDNHYDDAKLRAVTEAIRDGDYEGLSLLMGEPLEGLVGCIRSAFGTTPGRRLLAADLASIESAVVGWLFGVKNILAAFAAGRDPYKDFATFFYRKPYAEVTKAERKICKPPALGAAYRLGGGEIRDGRRTGLWGYAENMGVVDMTRDQAHRAVKVFREEYAPEVAQAWKDLEAAVRRAMQDGAGRVRVGKIAFERMKPYMTLILPSGRRIFYFQPRIETRVVETGKMIRRRSRGMFLDGAPEGQWIEVPETYERKVFTYMGQNQDTGKWTRLENHGGRFVEQMTQATAREVLAFGMLRLHRKGYRLCAHIHDEAVAEQRYDDPEHTLDRMIETLKEPVEWAPGLPLGAAGWEGRFYRK